MFMQKRSPSELRVDEIINGLVIDEFKRVGVLRETPRFGLQMDSQRINEINANPIRYQQHI